LASNEPRIFSAAGWLAPRCPEPRAGCIRLGRLCNFT
jgi:hypothetical protein